MTSLIRGRLIFGVDRKTGKQDFRCLVYQGAKGETPPTSIPVGELSADLIGRPEPEIHVELELVLGKPRRIRPAGGAWVPPAASPPPVSGANANRGPRPGGNAQAGGGQAPKTAQPAVHRFHNPYSFIPAPDRPITGPLADNVPPSHDRYHPDLYSGRISVELRVETPLLLPDAARAEERENGHRVFPVRTRSDGAPDLPVTSVKGALRAAFEAVTNSRFGVFAGHEGRLGLRMDARDGLRMVPARIKGDMLELHEGTRDRTMPAAWLPRYSAGNSTDLYGHGITYPGGGIPAHGDNVQCWLQLFHHDRRNFDYWRVTAIAPIDGRLPDKAPQIMSTGHHQARTETKRIKGWVYVTNQNFSRKHDERVFFSVGEPRKVNMREAWRQAWRELVADSRAIHERELELRLRQHGGDVTAYARFLGSSPGQTAWSPHVYDERWQELTDGSLCYAQVNRQGEVQGLYPVMISRDLHAAAPSRLLPDSLHPATSLNGLSPADRVFGWVGQKGKGAYRGNLRIGPINPQGGAELIENFARPLPLAILGQPKPHYARFYVARNRQGSAQPSGLQRPETAYAAGKGLRGRKMYPHHRDLPAHYWQDADRDDVRRPVAGNRYREYLRVSPDPNDRPEQRQDNQNRSIAGWVRPGSRFRFDIDVSNLSSVEAGALLWLLSLPEEMFHRIGGGKPLGFGSVRLSLVGSELHKGTVLRDHLVSFSTGRPSATDVETLINSFKEASCQAAKVKDFDRIPWIAGFKTMARGIGSDQMPIHYPRVGRPGNFYPPPATKGENFKWFQQNDLPGGRYALPDADELEDPPPLCIFIMD